MNRGVEDVLFEMVGLCEELSVPYAVMGGIAVRVHGIPRPTFDVDMQLTIAQPQLECLFDAAVELGYTIAEPFRAGWRDEVGGMPLVKLRTFLAADRGVDVDIFINQTQFQQSLMDRRQTVKFHDRDLYFVTAEDLVLLKLLANRPRDVGDVADVLFVQGQLDEAYLRRWAKALQISDRLATALNQT